MGYLSMYRSVSSYRLVLSIFDSSGPFEVAVVGLALPGVYRLIDQPAAIYWFYRFLIQMDLLE